MSASILGVKAWANISPEKLKETVEKATIPNGKTYDGQKLFDLLDAIPSIWQKPDETNDSVCIWNYPVSNQMETWTVTTKDGKTAEVCLVWNEGEPLPDSFCILES